MRKVVFLLALVAAASFVRGSAAETFKIIHVGDLDALLRQHAADLWIYDVNPPSLRAKEGIVPGARLLSSSEGFDVAADLPPAKDAKLVFYCANTH
jgi:rhodanese-related sulfurtransferase